jgi:DNA repair protein RecN (Recombination protein N)
MIRRLLLRDLLSFREVRLEFVPGLVVLTGPSGAGKSLLMQAILANLGHGNSEAKLCELEMDLPAGMEAEDLLLEDPLVIRALRRERVRYTLNDQQISRRRLTELLAPRVDYLSVRDRGGFENERLLELLDGVAGGEEPFPLLREEYGRRYRIFREKERELERILAEEKEMADRIEFARFEIDKIASIDPKEGEYEELLAIKQRLSRLDRIKETAQRAAAIFETEQSVEELFGLMERDGSYFTEAMNQLRIDLEEVESLAEELEEVDVEEVLDRLEKLSALIRRHGSISEALAYKAAREEELAGYEHLEADKSGLERFLAEEREALEALAAELSRGRREAAERIAERIAPILERLKLPPLTFDFETVPLGERGSDRVDLRLEDSGTATLSGGEFNRLRLALMSVAAEGSEPRIIVLDEIDANVSGDESIAIAEMIDTLARRHQVFAISHQPHLSARAHQHILVRREGGVSVAESLDEEGRIREIARIVSGEGADEEATAFAAKLRRSAETKGETP